MMQLWYCFFFFKQKTAYEMRISDWSSDVCSSDLKVTSRMIGDRLRREAEGNVAIRITETAGRDAFEVAGRGELQLAVLIETMRREGYELAISRPRVVMQSDPRTGQSLEPIEAVTLDDAAGYAGGVGATLSQRKAEQSD